MEPRLALIVPADLPALAAAWSPAYSDELAAAHRVLAEHERGDLSHVLGAVLDRIPRLAALVMEDELLVGEALDEAEHALEVLEGAVIEAHAADLIPGARLLRLGAPWRSYEGGARRT